MIHEPNDEFIETNSSGVTLSNIVVEARFFNPYPTSEGTWSSGFLIRRTGGNANHRIYIHSDGDWYHYMSTGTAESSQQLQRVPFTGIDTSSEGSNHLRLIAKGDEGWLFINGTFAGKLDLTGWDQSGDVIAATGLRTGDEVEGKATVFQDFSVWSLSNTYGPTSDSLIHEPDDNRLETLSSSVSLADTIVEARFFNPYSTAEGTWTGGFIIRETGFNAQHRIFIRSNGNWYHYLATGTQESLDRIQSAPFAGIDISPSGSNHLRLFTLGDEGWLFINGDLAGKMNLSGWSPSGDVQATIEFFNGDGISGKATVFQGFSVWALGQ